MKLKTSHIFFLMLALIGMNYIPIANADLTCPEDYPQYSSSAHDDNTRITYTEKWYRVCVKLNIVERRWVTYGGPNCIKTYSSWGVHSFSYSNLREEKSQGIYTRFSWPISYSVGGTNPYVMAEGKSKRYIFHSFDTTELKIQFDASTRQFTVTHWINGNVVSQ